MEEVLLVKCDNSSLYEFSSKSVPALDDTWEGSWVISEELGSTPLVEGVLIKNLDIMNNDSLISEDYKKSYKIFESSGTEKVTFNDDVILDNGSTVSGVITEANGVTAIPNKYIYVTLKGLFVPHTREIRLKTDDNGAFIYSFNIGKTIKIPLNSFFIFQLMPHDTENLEPKKYYLTVEVRQKDILGNLIFSKEVLTTKLKILQQGLL